MALNLEEKKAIVAEVSEVASQAISVVAADYCGLTVGQMNDLRSQAREKGVYLRVVRNTLAKRALDNTDFACLQPALVGPMVLAFANNEPGAAARLLRDFGKQNKELEVKALSLSGELLGPEKLDVVASLPTWEEAVARLLNVMKAPVTKLTRTLAEPPAKITRVLAAIRDQKQAS